MQGVAGAKRKENGVMAQQSHFRMGKESDPQAKNMGQHFSTSACPLFLPIKITKQTNATGGATIAGQNEKMNGGNNYVID